MNSNVNFAKISTKKLTDLLSTELSDESRTAINEVLASRQQTSQSTQEVVVNDITEEEQAILDQASAAKKAPKLSIEECEALALELKPNLGHLCQVVPSGSISWSDGQIVGVIVDKRNNKVLYAIKLTEDKKRILKAYNSEFLKISEEVGEVATRTRGTSNIEKLPDAELVAKALELGAQIVGQQVEFEPFKPIEGVTVLAGTIIGITPEKRVGKLLIKIKATHAGVELTGYKVEGNYKLLDTFDEEVQAAYAKRQEARSNPAATPEERLALVQTKLEKANAEVIKWTNIQAQRADELAVAKAEYETWLSTQEANIL